MVVSEEVNKIDNPSKEFICKVCYVPKRFSTKYNLKVHMKSKHDGRNDKVKIGNMFMNLSEDQINNQEFKIAHCNISNDKFPCLQELNIHKEN